MTDMRTLGKIATRANMLAVAAHAAGATGLTT